MSRLLLLGALLLSAWAASSMASQPSVHGCAFSRAPTTYEAARNRGAYLLGIELAAHNMLFPDDTFFGTPNVETGLRGARTVLEEPYIPPTLLKANGWIESALSQADGDTAFDAVGPALISFDCGHGIMQITSGMTNPADSVWPSRQQALIATHYLYNIARGAVILVDKWNYAPEARPIAGTDTDSDPHIVENWYFAVWGYNGFTGPTANRSNHPADPDYGQWPRTGFSCGPANDGYGHRYDLYPYQELVFGCAARPPSVDGVQLWTPLPLSLPNLDDPLWSEPLDLANFPPCVSSTFDCAAMDMPSPQPWHRDETPRPADGITPYLLGSPVLAVSRRTVNEAVHEVTISNTGQGILAWRARPAKPWVTVDKLGGVALSPDVTCAEGASCERSPTLTIMWQDEKGAGWVDIESLTTGEAVRVNIITQRYDANCDGATNAIDALLVLQYNAGIVPSLECVQNADANGDGLVNALDAAIILQFDAGLIV